MSFVKYLNKHKRIKHPPFIPGNRQNVFVLGPPKIPPRQKRPIPRGSSIFAYYYNLNSLPIHYCSEIPNRLFKWTVPLKQLDVVYLLPIFCNGIQENHLPYSEIARIGAEELIILGQEKILPILSEIIWQMRRAIETAMDKPVLNAIHLLNILMNCNIKVAEKLARLVKPLLMPLRLLKCSQKMDGIFIEPSIKPFTDIDNFLNKLVEFGGNDIYLEIKSIFPIYEYDTKGDYYINEI